MFRIFLIAALLAVTPFSCTGMDTTCTEHDGSCNAAVNLLLYQRFGPSAITSLSSADTSAVHKSDSFTLTFREAMVTQDDAANFRTTCRIGGSIGAVNVAWDSTATTLTISPQSAWNTGDGQTLQLFDCYDVFGYRIDAITLTYFVADAVVYVDSATGNDGNSGGKSDPFATIPAAMTAVQPNCASSGTFCVVNVAGGSYTTSTGITMLQRVSLFGGYGDTFRSRPAPNLEANAASASIVTFTGTNPIQVFSYSTSATYLDGFTITTQDTTITSQIAINFTGGNDNVIRNNVIRTGNVSSATFGVSVIAYGSSLNGNRFQRNHIHGGSSNGSGNNVGISANAAGSFIQDFSNNVVVGGENTGSGYSAALNIGAAVGRGSFHNNTFRAGSAFTENTRVVAIASTATPIIINNIILSAGGISSDFCVHEAVATANPLEFRHNNLFGCVSGLYFDNGSTIVDNLNTTLSGGVCPGGTTLGECFVTNVNPALDTTTSAFSPSASSPCAVTRGGLEIPDSVTDDYNRTYRTAGWSVGATEWNGSCL